MLPGEFSRIQLLSVAAVMRMAKNPMQCARIRPLIFQALESRSCRGHTVMIFATSTTVKKLPITPANPTCRYTLIEPGRGLGFLCLGFGQRAKPVAFHCPLGDNG